MAYRFRAFLILIIIGFTGCKKEKDTNSPSVHIHSPNEGATFFYYNLISVGAHVTDDRTIEKIDIDIVDAANRIYLSADDIFPGTGKYDVQLNIAHENLYLETGTYYVRVTADDGENVTTEFREIQLFEAPRVLIKTMAMRENGTSSVADSLNNGSSYPWFQLSALAFPMFNSRTKELIASENDQNRMVVYDFSLGMPVNLNSFDLISGATVTAGATDQETRENYFGLSNGEIVKYGSTGFQMMGSSIGKVIRHLLITDEWIYGVVSPLADPAGSEMHVWNKQTGSFIQSLPIGFDVRGITEAGNEDELFIAGNSSNEAVFRKYFRSSNGINDVFSFYESSPIIAFEEGSENNFYAAHENGVAYYVNNMQSYQLNNSISAQDIAYEPLNSRVYVTSSDGIHVMNQPCSQEVSFYPGNNFVDVLFIYNK
jgi:hypothetical protein